MERRPSPPALDDSQINRSVGQPESLVRQRSQSYSDGVLPKRTCVVAGCLGDIYGRGYCLSHFQMYVLTKPDVDVSLEISRPSVINTNTKTSSSYAVDGIHEEEVSSDNNLDPQDSHVVDKDHKVKISTRMHLKKFWASRFSKFATTRQIIGQADYVGLAGTTVLRVLKLITQATLGKAVAKAYREILLSTIAKWKVLVDGSAIVLSPPFIDQLASFGSCMTETLDRIVTYQNKVPGGASDVCARRALLRLDMFSEACHSFFDTVLNLLGPFFQAKNVIKLKACLEYYSGIDFLLVFSEPRWREEQRMLREGIGTMLKDHIAPPCTRDKCYHPQLMPCGPFKGSKFCTQHHIEILHSPPLWFFLPSASGTGMPSFREFCSDPADANKFFLQREIASYRAARRRVIRLQQVRFIFATFLFKSAPRRVVFEDHILGPVQVVVPHPGFYPSPSLFRPLEHVLSEQIKAIFHRFQESPTFRKAVPEFTVPYCIASRYSLELEKEEQELAQRKIKFNDHAEPLVLFGQIYESDSEAEKQREEEAEQKHLEQQRVARAQRKAERKRRRVAGKPISPSSEEEDMDEDIDSDNKSGGRNLAKQVAASESFSLNREKEEREERMQTELLQREFATNMVQVQSAEDLKTMILAAEACRTGGGLAPSGSRRSSEAGKSVLRSQSFSRSSMNSFDTSSSVPSSSRSSGSSASSSQLFSHLATPGRGSATDPQLQRSFSESGWAKHPVSPTSPTRTLSAPASALLKSASAVVPSPCSPPLSPRPHSHSLSIPGRKSFLGGLGFGSPSHGKQKSEDTSPKSGGSSPSPVSLGGAPQPSPVTLGKRAEPRSNRGVTAFLRHFHRGSGSQITGTGSGQNSRDISLHNPKGSGSDNNENEEAERDRLESEHSMAKQGKPARAKPRSASVISTSPSPSPSPAPSPMPATPASTSHATVFGRSILGGLMARKASVGSGGSHGGEGSGAGAGAGAGTGAGAGGGGGGYNTAALSRNSSGESSSYSTTSMSRSNSGDSGPYNPTTMSRNNSGDNKDETTNTKTKSNPNASTTQTTSSPNASTKPTTGTNTGLSATVVPITTISTSSTSSTTTITSTTVGASGKAKPAISNLAIPKSEGKLSKPHTPSVTSAQSSTASNSPSSPPNSNLSPNSSQKDSNPSSIPNPNIANSTTKTNQSNRVKPSTSAPSQQPKRVVPLTSTATSAKPATTTINSPKPKINRSGNTNEKLDNTSRVQGTNVSAKSVSIQNGSSSQAD